MNRAIRMVIFQAATVAATGGSMLFVAHEARAAPSQSTQMVKIGNFTFAQKSITVRPGTTVTWENDDDIPHTVVAKNLAFKSKVLDTGDRFSFTFAKAGQFDYYCSIHPHMTGTVIVKA